MPPGRTCGRARGKGSRKGMSKMNIDKKIVDDLVANDISFVTTVPCKQLAGVIEEVERRDEVFHIPSNKEDEGMGLCAGAWMGGNVRRSSCRTRRLG